MRIAIAGSGRLGLSLMAPLLESSHEIVALVQNGRLARGLGRRLRTASSIVFAPNSSVIGLAVRHRIPVLWIDRMSEKELMPLRALGPDVLLVGGFGIILKEPILGLPRIGCVNAHSSLLPKHRGPNPFAAVILAGEQESGVTFHVMDAGIDTGDILEQFPYPLEADDTALTAHDKACDVAAERVVSVMDRIEREGLRGAPQDPALASYDGKLEDRAAQIDWAKPAREIERMARACRPFFLPRFRHRGRTVFVTQLTVDETPANAAPATVIESVPRVKIAAGQGAIVIEAAYVTYPFPWLWPAPWSRPKPGQKVS